MTSAGESVKSYYHRLGIIGGERSGFGFCHITCTWWEVIADFGVGEGGDDNVESEVAMVPRVLEG